MFQSNSLDFKQTNQINFQFNIFEDLKWKRKKYSFFDNKRNEILICNLSKKAIFTHDLVYYHI